MQFDLPELVRDFAMSVKAVDERRPIATNARSKIQFMAGIGPHSETAALALITSELSLRDPQRYSRFFTSVAYTGTKKKCDLCFGTTPNWDWAIEVKLLRFMGDNNKPNDHMLMHLLSPYPEHRSALTDLDKLKTWVGPRKKAVLIYGFDHPRWPLEPALGAFEALATSRARISHRVQADFVDLVHPIHSNGTVVAWELLI